MTIAEKIIGISFYPDTCGSAIECVTKKDALEAMKQVAWEAWKQNHKEWCIGRAIKYEDDCPYMSRDFESWWNKQI